MIPIWAKDKHGKWQLFPYDELETFTDGVQGFRTMTDRNAWWHLVHYDPGNARYVLRKDYKR